MTEIGKNAGSADGFIVARGLCKTYSLGRTRLEVLKGVSLSIRRTEVVGIIGASGAGKSTLLHLLGGLDTPTEGSVAVGGTDLFRLSSTGRARWRSKRVGFVFQSYQLLGELNALENVCLAGRLGNLTSNTVVNSGREVLEAVGLGNRLHHRPSELSGGEQQRVAIARALVNKPDLLLADEPTGNLDSKTGESIIQLLLGLQRQHGMTLVIVTHDISIGRQAQRVLEIADGKIINETTGEA